jgi:hypothetical protein
VLYSLHSHLVFSLILSYFVSSVLPRIHYFSLSFLSACPPFIFRLISPFPVQSSPD